jgi:hypothetical protein
MDIYFLDMDADDAFSVARIDSKAEEDLMLLNHSDDPIDQLVHRLMTGIVPKSWAASHPWIIKTLPYMLAIAWIDFNTW